MKKQKKVDIAKFEAEKQTETDPQRFKSRTTLLNTKNAKLDEDIINLLQDLQNQRRANRKREKQVNESVKDRLQKIQKLYMDTTYTLDPELRKQGVLDVTNRYAFMEMENELFLKNYANIDINLEYYKQRLKKLEAQYQTVVSSNSLEIDQLQRQLARYKKLQQEQHQNNAKLQKQFQKKEEYYSLIDTEIRDYRTKFGVVEEKSQRLQKQLSDRINEFNGRQKSDADKISNANSAMINTQNLINMTAGKTIDLEIKGLEVNYSSMKL